MTENATPVLSRVSSYWASWCDGFWLCFGLVIAVALSFSIPVAVFTWVLKAAGAGVLKSLVSLCGAAFLTVISPMIFSRVFRELDYPRGRQRAEKARPEVPGAYKRSSSTPP